MAFRKTSRDAGHTHRWTDSKVLTSRNSGHTHRIDKKRKIALNSGTGHTHKLL